METYWEHFWPCLEGGCAGRICAVCVGRLRLFLLLCYFKFHFRACRRTEPNVSLHNDITVRGHLALVQNSFCSLPSEGYTFVCYLFLTTFIVSSLVRLREGGNKTKMTHGDEQ